MKEKGILAIFLEKGIKILLKKECKQIGKIKIDIAASSIQIIKGIIQKIHIIAEKINYKDILFDEIELEANKVNINFKLSNKELKFKDDPKIKFKISLSESSIRVILLSYHWNWIGKMITKELLNQEQLKYLKIKNNQILIKGSTNENTFAEEEKIEIKAESGKIYLSSKNYNKSINIPIEEKVYVENLTIKNNLIIIFATSSISF
tara:strand:+ start:64 stop:681 length:618 start_codon:yes stop_codon:yes gene_type:complete